MTVGSGRAAGGTPDPPADGELVARILAGDREAYATLVRRHQEPLYRHALGMVGHADVAADLVQDALIKAYTDLDSCRDPDRFGAWAYRIVANRAKDYLKSPRRRTVALDAGPELVARGGPDRELDQSETAALLQGALARLPEAQREAFLLKHVEDLSYEEMAEQLGAGVSALKMRVMRARETLQELLGPVFGEPPAES